ncbi:MAG: undecaprenyldiphospho-muramoylpentapeptide beta-N-acetylglucosaminyltransferase [Chloroflexi bacterium]|nr:undecaprenyldiphospho-muramoylpentapeptide beta-N-acetylglucosaminyltransferase [Chloroflexota bacterium]
MRLLICAGGTGGGVYPALAVLHALKNKRSETETLWIGSEGGMEAELVKREGIAFDTIPSAGLHGVGLRALPRNVSQLSKGVLASRRILREFKPDVLFFTGGYVAGPMALAGRRIPTLLYVPDIEPGLALKSLARFADRIAVTAEDSQKYFSRKVIVTGYPLRADLMSWTKQKARRTLKLDDDLPVLLVVGGSKGARSINQVIVPNLPTLLEMAQVVHISGQLDWEAVQIARDGLTSAQRTRYHAFPYLHEEMGAALASADLVVARAGASTLGEFPFFGLPAILIPYPYAWRYQKVNADFLAQRGAAVIIKDEFLKSELLPVVKDLIENPSKRRAMQIAMKSLARVHAANAIAGQLLELGGQRP